MYRNDLYHWGIRGMRWGVRRFQNPDGTLTALGKKRESSEDSKTVAELRTKKVNQLSNAELRKVNERSQLEQQYSNLNKNSLQKGLAFVTAATAVMGTALNMYNNSSKIVKIGKRIVGEFSKKAVG